jgi:hypothetical protein
MKQNHITRRAFALSSIALTAFGLSSFATVSAAEQPIPKPDAKPADMSKPVQVFLIMGQSNAVGMGKVAILEAAVKQKNKYPYLVDKDGNWVTRQDVRFVQYMSGKGPPKTNSCASSLVISVWNMRSVILLGMPSMLRS